MKQVTTVCPRDCYDTCALLATLDESGRLVSVRGDPTHPLTRGLTCPRAAADPQHVYQNRVPEPCLSPKSKSKHGPGENPAATDGGMSTGCSSDSEDTDDTENYVESPRLGGEPASGDGFRAVSWQQALDVVAQKLSETLQRRGPEAVLYLTYSGNTGLLTLDIPQRLWNALGATQTDLALCSKSGSLGLVLHYGARYGVRPDELGDAGLIVFWGFNAAVSSLHLWSLALEARKRHGTRIVAIDSRRSETAARADLWVRPRPGSDVALAYGLINLLLEMGAADRDFLARWTLGLEELRAEASRWTPQRVQEVSGVAEEQLRRLADEYAQHRPAATMIGIGLQKCDHGADQVRAVSFIPAILGQHRGFFYSNSEAFSINRELLSGEALTGKRSPIVQQVALPEMMRDGQFKFVYISGMNPAVTLPNSRACIEGLSQPDVFVVVHETHWTETARCADVVLPAPGYLEKADLVPPWSHNCLQLSPQVIRPVTDSRGEVRVMQELALRLGLKDGWLYQDPWVVAEQSLQGAFEDGDWKTSLSGARVHLKSQARASYPTPSGKIEFSSTLAQQMGLSALPRQAPLAVPPRDEFIFLNSASAHYTSSQFRDVYGPIPALVVVNPRDAQDLGIAEGDAVLLTTQLGAARAQATISDAVSKGTVWSPRQWAGQNALLSSQPQEIGHGPRFNSTRVQIRPVGH